MKAYRVSIKDEDDAGAEIVFANTVSEAKKQTGDLDYDSWLDIRAVRDKRYDDMENLTPVELALKQWRDGWRFNDMEDPERTEATDAEFIEWYENNF